MQIAFAITCRGRSQHIKLTLPRNLADNKKAKFVLLDYGSPDDLLEYVQTNHTDEIQSGRLAIYSYEADRFRMAHGHRHEHVITEEVTNKEGETTSEQSWTRKKKKK